MTPRRDTPLDPEAILHALAEHGVDCLLIGGLAAQAHGHIRTTQDVDLLPDPAPENLERLARALRALHAVPAGPEAGKPAPPSARALAARPVTALETRAGGIDVHLRPPGSAPYPDLRARALRLDVAGTSVGVVGLDDLIAMKQASGRPIDRADVRALTALESGDG